MLQDVAGVDAGQGGVAEGEVGGVQAGDDGHPGEGLAVEPEGPRDRAQPASQIDEWPESGGPDSGAPGGQLHTD